MEKAEHNQFSEFLDFSVPMLMGHLERKEGMTSDFKWQCVEAQDLLSLKLQLRLLTSHCL